MVISTGVPPLVVWWSGGYAVIGTRGRRLHATFWLALVVTGY